ncbi:MAG: hypothetical protein ABI445_24260 [Polyangia bacterium]
MTALVTLYAFLAAHYVALASAAVIIAATVANQLYPDGKLPKALAIAIDLLSLAAKPRYVGIVGPVSLPGFVSRRPGASTIPNVPPPALGLVLLLGLGLTACGLPPLPTPDPMAYRAAFKACLQNEGVNDIGPESNRIWLILDQGGNSAIEIEGKIEQVALTVGAEAGRICIDCAVIAWETSNPVTPNKAATPSQGAARLYKARHLSSPTLHHAAVGK